MDWSRYLAAVAVTTARLRAVVTPARARSAAAAFLVMAAGIAAIIALPSGPAAGQVDALSVPLARSAPVTYVDSGSPALDKAQRTAATALTAARTAAHEAHLIHVTHVARLAAQKKAALAEAIAQSAPPARAPASSRPPRGGTGQAGPPAVSGGSSSSSGSSGCSDPSGQLNASQMTMLWLCAGGPSWAVSHALRIATCESGWNTRAYNPSGATGLWQILGQVTAFWGSLYDAHVNALNAVAKFRASGGTFAQWVCQ